MFKSTKREDLQHVGLEFLNRTYPEVIKAVELAFRKLLSRLTSDEIPHIACGFEGVPLSVGQQDNYISPVFTRAKQIKATGYILTRNTVIAVPDTAAKVQSTSVLGAIFKAFVDNRPVYDFVLDDCLNCTESEYAKRCR